MACIPGSAGGDTLKGTAKDACITLLAGDDWADGLGGNDTIDGGPGKDKLISNLRANFANYICASNSGSVAELRAGNDWFDNAPGQDLIWIQGFAPSEATFGVFGVDTVIRVASARSDSAKLGMLGEAITLKKCQAGSHLLDNSRLVVLSENSPVTPLIL